MYWVLGAGRGRLCQGLRLQAAAGTAESCGEHSTAECTASKGEAEIERCRHCHHEGRCCSRRQEAGEADLCPLPAGLAQVGEQVAGMLVMPRQLPPVLELELEPGALAGRLVEGLVQLRAGPAGRQAVVVLPVVVLVQAGLPDLAWVLVRARPPPRLTARGRGLVGRRRPALVLAP